MSSKKIHTYMKYFFVGILQAFKKVKVGKNDLLFSKNPEISTTKEVYAGCPELPPGLRQVQA